MDAKATVERLRRDELERQPDQVPADGERFGRKLQDGTPRVSPSQISLVLDCGEKWRRRYLLGETEATSFSQFYGTTFHAVMEDVLKAQMESKTYADPAAVQAHAREVAAAIFADDDIIARLKDPEEVKGKANVLADELAALAGETAVWLIKNEVVPMGSEETVIQRLVVDGLEVANLGRYDGYVHIGSRNTVAMLDFKTSAKSPSMTKDGAGFQAKRSHALAGLSYSDAILKDGSGRKVDELLILYAVRTKQPRVLPAYVPVNESMLAWGRVVTEGAIRIIKLGALAPNPQGWGCSERYCGSFNKCPAAATGLEA